MKGILWGIEWKLWNLRVVILFVYMDDGADEPQPQKRAQRGEIDNF